MFGQARQRIVESAVPPSASDPNRVPEWLANDDRGAIENASNARNGVMYWILAPYLHSTIHLLFELDYPHYMVCCCATIPSLYARSVNEVLIKQPLGT